MLQKGNLLVAIFVLGLSVSAVSQNNSVTIGSNATNNNAVLWLVPNGGQGLLLPSISTDTRTGMNVQFADAGMMVYDNGQNVLYYWNGTNWVSLSNNGSAAITLSGDVSGQTSATVVKAIQGNNVMAVTPSDQQVLKWNATNQQWEPSTDNVGPTYTAGTAINISSNTISVANGAITNAQLASDAVTDTNINSVSPSKLTQAGATTGQVLTWNGTTWVASTPTAQVNSDWNATSGVSQILNKPLLAAVATSGNYSDLSGTPTIPAAQVNSDWSAISGIAQILNKPTLAAIATSGNYSDLINKPTLAAVATSGSYTDLTNKPALATVATTGNYSDLSGTPTIPASQVNSDWNATSGVSQILNKPLLAAVATSGNYSDLSGTPTIPAAQVNSDWSAISGIAQILNKPTLAAIATSGDYSDLINKPTLAAVATSGSYIDLSNKPVLATVATTGSYTDLTNKPALATVATTGNYSDLSGTPTIPAAQVNSDWSAISGIAQILNKPTLAAIATSGNYSDLSGTPTQVSAFTNDANYIKLSSLSASSPLSYNNTSGVFSLSGSVVDANISSAANWNLAYNNRIASLTTTGSNGAATLLSNTLNIPNYTLSGLGGQPLNTKLTSISSLTDVNGYLLNNGSGNFSYTMPSYSQLTGLVPTWNQNTTGTASNITATSNSTLTTLSALSLPYSQLSGAVPTWNQNTTGSAGSVVNSITFNNGGSGASSGSAFNGSSAATISYNTIGAQPILVSGTNIQSINGSSILTSGNLSLQTPITLTTAGTSGASTFLSNTLNIPNYTLSGLGGQPLNTNLTSISSLTNANGYLLNDGTGNFSYTMPSYSQLTGTVPTWNQNTTGTASNITATSNSTLTTLSALSLPYSQLSGTVPIWNQNTTGTASNITAVSNSTLTTLSALSLPTSQLSGTISNAQLTNNSFYIGTTSISLGRASATQALTGITSIDGSAATLTTPRTFNVSGDATGTAQSFDGGSNITIPVSVTKINGNTVPSNASGSLTNDGTGTLTWTQIAPAPIAFCNVSSNGTKNAATSNVATVIKSSTGTYDITVTGVDFTTLSNYVVTATAVSGGFTSITVTNSGSSLRIQTQTLTCVAVCSFSAADVGFNVVIYKP